MKMFFDFFLFQGLCTNAGLEWSAAAPASAFSLPSPSEEGKNYTLHLRLHLFLHSVARAISFSSER